MKHILSSQGSFALEKLARSRALCAFDFDGTLAPIVADRDAAAMRARTRELFRAVCDLYPCAVISGRSCADVAPRLGGARVKHVIGNHGLEPGIGLESFAGTVRAALPLLEAALSAWPGVDVEDKRFSLAVHYRRSTRRQEAEEAIHAAIAGLPMAMRTVAGKLVVNVVPADAPHKGDALSQLREQEGAELALYAGDDVTDEDVFELPASDWVVGVRVGPPGGSKASFFLRDQREMDVLLRTLVALRTAGAGP